MSNTVYTIALAGLLHDVGKFAERAGMEVSQGYRDDNEHLYQPEYKGRRSHRHALYTAAFIEQFAGLLPTLPTIGETKSGDSLINLAAMHHKPETALQWLVTAADRLSSGLDRQVFEGEEEGTEIRNFRRTRLIPITEQLLRGREFYDKDSLDSYRFRYRLRQLTPEQVFPVERSEAEPSDDAAARQEYSALFSTFTDALAALANREQPALWIDHFTSLWEQFASCIPAATVGKVIPDVSLYDHCRATAALAVSLFSYHSATSTLREADIRDNETEKFLLITGDFSGIQNFIFSEGGSTNRAAAKLLRGRSFCVSLLSELAGEALCRELGLPITSILLNAAGKFTLLAPNLPETQTVVQRVESELNRWLVEHFFGEVAIGFFSVAASGNDFAMGRFPSLWERLAKAGDGKKYRKFALDEHGGVVAGYLDRFDNRLDEPLCPFCGKRPADPATKSDHLPGDKAVTACGICRDHIQIGAQLIKARSVALVKTDAELPGSRLKQPLFGTYQLSFDIGPEQAKRFAENGALIWHRHLVRAGEPLTGHLALRFIGGYVPVYGKTDEDDIDRLLHGRKSDQKKDELFDMIREGGVKSFHHIAKAALEPRADDDGRFIGTEALGILKADVDNLGKLFACGLPEERLNLSRLATFSRQMNAFFSVYLPNLLATDKRFRNIYTVFAGGDDLFLIGPWNRIIEFAGVMRTSFSRFACGNEQITISAGITVDKPGIPVPALAAQAELGLDAAKDSGRNAVTLFGETVSWVEFEQLMEIRKTLETWQRAGYVGKAMLYRFNEFLSQARKEKQLRESKKPIDLREMDCLSWRSRFTYSATRNVGKTLDKETRKKALDEVMQATAWLLDLDGKLKIALWQVLYNQR